MYLHYPREPVSGRRQPVLCDAEGVPERDITLRTANVSCPECRRRLRQELAEWEARDGGLH